MGSFKLYPDIETDQQYRVEIPTEIHQILYRIAWINSITIIISMLSITLSWFYINIQRNHNRQIEELIELTSKCLSIVDIICQEKKQKTNIKTVVSESVRQNIQLIESDLIVSESNLVDELQTNAYLSEEETKTMKLRNRSDQAHLFAENLELLDDGNFLRVLDILRRCSFGHIACSLKASYEYFKTTKALAVTSHLICPICRLRYEVDIKDLRCELKKEELLPFSLYIDINDCQARRGHQDYLWKKLFSHLKSLKDESVENKFITIFDTPRHQGLYDCFLKKFPTHFECFCVSSI